MSTRTAAPKAASSNDYLYTFTGIRGTQILDGLRFLLDQRDPLEKRLIHVLTNNPIEANVAFLLATSTAFYQAEVAANPKINTWKMRYTTFQPVLRWAMRIFSRKPNADGRLPRW